MGKNEPDPIAGTVWPLREGQVRELGLQSSRVQAGAESSGTEFDLGFILRVAWVWRWLILGAAAAGLLGGLITTLLMTPIYRASVLLELNPPTVELIGEERSDERARSDQNFLATQYGLLQSRALAERVAQELGLLSNPAIAPQDVDATTRERIVVDTLLSNLDVVPERESRLVAVSFSSEDPQLAARVANGFAESFIGSTLERRYQSSSYARNFLERQIQVIRRELEDSERRLIAYAQRQGIINTGSSGEGTASSIEASSPTADSLTSINRALSEATARRIAAEERYRQATSAGPTVEVGERTSTLRNQIAALEAEYQEKLATFQPEYPQMVQLRSRIEALRRSIQAEASNVRAGRAGTLQREYQAALAEERGLQSRVEELRRAVLNLQGRSIQYNILRREVDTNRSLYDALLQRYKEIGVAGGIGTSQASVVDRATVPASPYKPNLILNLVVGLALAVVAGAATALLLEFLNDTIKTPDDVRAKLGVAYLGGVPPAESGKVVGDVADVSSAVAEAYFSVMTSLQFTTENGAPNVLLVTSTRPAEGKSTTAWAIANALARLGSKVLLIDADMRKPAFVTGGEKKDGLANLLTSRESLMSHVVKPESADRVWLLPCGPLPPNPAELVSSPRLGAVLDEARTHFDHVIIDSPPILGLADAPVLASSADGVLIVIEAGKTRTRAVSEALGRLRQTGALIVGAVLTRYKHDSIGYGYSYNAYSYNSEGHERERQREIRLIVAEDKRG
jgi:capsular exopolysaccharide synthesis family protein